MGGGRNPRYPLLPGVFQAVYPNPIPTTAYDPTLSSQTSSPPPPAQSDSNLLASVAAKMESASSGPIFESSLAQLKRCAWLQMKSSSTTSSSEGPGWSSLRSELGKAGISADEYKKLDEVKDPRVDQLSYGDAPTLMSKYGF